MVRKNSLTTKTPLSKSKQLANKPSVAPQAEGNITENLWENLFGENFESLNVEGEKNTPNGGEFSKFRESGVLSESNTCFFF